MIFQPSITVILMTTLILYLVPVSTTSRVLQETEIGSNNDTYINLERKGRQERSIPSKHPGSFDYCHGSKFVTKYITKGSGSTLKVLESARKLSISWFHAAACCRSKGYNLANINGEADLKAYYKARNGQWEIGWSDVHGFSNKWKNLKGIYPQGDIIRGPNKAVNPGQCMEIGVRTKSSTTFYLHYSLDCNKKYNEWVLCEEDDPLVPRPTYNGNNMLTESILWQGPDNAKYYYENILKNSLSYETPNPLSRPKSTPNGPFAVSQEDDVEPFISSGKPSYKSEKYVNSVDATSVYKARSKDPFISSPIINGKVFLFPGYQNYRKGDYFQNVVYCRNNYAEMVSIQSLEENKFFHHWISKVGPTFGKIHPGVWLGAEIVSQNKAIFWDNGDQNTFEHWNPGKPNFPAYSCLANGWLNSDKWFDNPCSDSSFYMACQRKVKGRKAVKKLPLAPTWGQVASA